jgi:hypothetical protein
MKIKALTGFETLHHTPEEDQDGVYTLRSERIEMKLGELRELPEKLAKRLIAGGHAEEAKDAG